MGETHYQDDFGAPRPQGSHEATDIMGGWRAPLVAVETGRVKLWTRSARAGCMLYLYGRSGNTYLYVHMNNDLTARNDNRGGCRAGVAFARGLRDGETVRAGELLGYMGDSGDANGIHDHVHFELHRGGRTPVSPYTTLRRAPQILFPVPPEQAHGRVADVALLLEGRVRSVTGGADGGWRLTLAVRKVRLWDGSTLAVARSVTITVPADTPVERRVRGALRPSFLDDAEIGDGAAVRTVPFAPTLAAQLASAGALAAATITLTPAVAQP